MNIIISRNRVNLLVSFADKDRVELLGAKWNSKNKTWFVPIGIDIVPFYKWWPEHLKIKYDWVGKQLNKRIHKNEWKPLSELSNLIA